MSVALLRPYCTPEAYLEAEAQSAIKHEYVDGEVYAMAGAGERHNRIAPNAAFHLRAAARGTPCGVFIADMKLRIAERNCFYYPDVMLACAAADDHPLYKSAPCAVVEVLSASTAGIDRREKWLAYRGLASLRACVMVDSERRYCEYFLRAAQGEWMHAELEAGDVLMLDCGAVRAALSLEDLYEDVDLAAWN